MNRKAKIAYLQMVIGVILFSIGFILFLNFNLSDWYAKERHSYISNNFTQLTLVLNDYKNVLDKAGNEITTNMIKYNTDTVANKFKNISIS